MVAQRAEADPLVDLVRRRVVEVGEQHDALGVARERVRGARRGDRAAVAAPALLGRRVDAADRAPRRPPPACAAPARPARRRRPPTATAARSAICCARRATPASALGQLELLAEGVEPAHRELEVGVASAARAAPGGGGSGGSSVAEREQPHLEPRRSLCSVGARRPRGGEALDGLDVAVDARHLDAVLAQRRDERARRRGRRRAGGRRAACG